MLFQRRRRPRPAPPDTGVVAPPAVPGQPQRDTTHPCPLTATRPVHLGHRAWWAQPWAPPRARERGQARALVALAVARGAGQKSPYRWRYGIIGARQCFTGVAPVLERFFQRQIKGGTEHSLSLPL